MVISKISVLGFNWQGIKETQRGLLKLILQGNVSQLSQSNTILSSQGSLVLKSAYCCSSATVPVCIDIKIPHSAPKLGAGVPWGPQHIQKYFIPNHTNTVPAKQCLAYMNVAVWLALWDTTSFQSPCFQYEQKIKRLAASCISICIENRAIPLQLWVLGGGDVSKS